MSSDLEHGRQEETLGRRLDSLEIPTRPPAFAAVHLTLLRALAPATDNNPWDEIQQFLEERSMILNAREKFLKHRGIHHQAQRLVESAAAAPRPAVEDRWSRRDGSPRHASPRMSSSFPSPLRMMPSGTPPGDPWALVAGLWHQRASQSQRDYGARVERHWHLLETVRREIRALEEEREYGRSVSKRARTRQVERMLSTNSPREKDPRGTAEEGDLDGWDRSATLELDTKLCLWNLLARDLERVLSE